MNVMPLNFLDVEAELNEISYPSGDYIFEIKKVERRPGIDGKAPRMVVHNSIVLGPWASEENKGRVLIMSYALSPAGAPFLKRLLRACDFTNGVLDQLDGQFDPQLLVGRRYVAALLNHGGKAITSAERNLDQAGATWRPETAAWRPKTKTYPAEEFTLRVKIMKFISRLKKACKQFLKVLREG